MKCTTPSPASLQQEHATLVDGGGKNFYHDTASSETSSSPSPSFLNLIVNARQHMMAASLSSPDAVGGLPTSPDPVKDQVKQQEQLLLRTTTAAVLTAAAAAASSQKHQQLLQQSTPPPRSPASTTAAAAAAAPASPRLVNGCKDLAAAAANNSGSNAAAAGKESRVNNNNTSSYVTGGGRLKFFKEGKCLLELTHRTVGDRGNTWIPSNKSIYWPPHGTQPIKSESSTSALSDTASNADCSSIPSPWQPSVIHRVKTKPSRLGDNLPDHVRSELNFVVKPPPCISSLRRKVRGLKRKRRRPYDPIVVGSLMMKMEAQAVTSRPKRRPFDLDRIKMASRLESCVTKVQNMPAKKKSHVPLVQIQTWSSKTSAAAAAAASRSASSKSTSIPPPNPPGCAPSATTTGGVTRVKSELFPVTETCTAATMPNASPYHSSKNHSKSKADKSVVDSAKSASIVSTALAKTLPITPTMARIKSESVHAPLISSSLISPDMQRVKVEIGASPGSNHHRPMTMSTSPISLDPRDAHFPSPRKRFLQNFENGGSPNKKHRLSTDSRGSVGSSDGGTSSPHLMQTNRTNSPFSLPALAASPPRPIAGRSSSFSIDSIISRDDGRDSKPLIRPVALPASPARGSHEAMKREFYPMEQDNTHLHHLQRNLSPPIVPISPYTSRGGIDPTRIDPRLAHLAGVAADPRLGLSPIGFPYNASSVMNPFALQASFASQMAASLWTPPVSSRPRSPPRSPPRTQTAAHHFTPTSLASMRPSPMRTMSAAPAHSVATSSASGGSPLMGGWLPQYRGEPRVTTPVSQNRDTASPDAPLNLSTRR